MCERFIYSIWNYFWPIEDEVKRQRREVERSNRHSERDIRLLDKQIAMKEKEIQKQPSQRQGLLQAQATAIASMQTRQNSAARQIAGNNQLLTQHQEVLASIQNQKMLKGNTKLLARVHGTTNAKEIHHQVHEYERNAEELGFINGEVTTTLSNLQHNHQDETGDEVLDRLVAEQTLQTTSSMPSVPPQDKVDDELERRLNALSRH